MPSANDRTPIVSLANLDAVFSDGLIEADVGALSIRVLGFNYEIAGLKGTFPGALGQVMTDNATNYLFLDAAGSLTVNTTGYPGVDHLRLGRVVATSGSLEVFSDRTILVTGTGGGGGGGGGYTTIQDEGTPLTQRAAFNVVGPLLTASDDAGQTRTNITTASFGTTAGSVAEGNDSRIPSQTENDALVGTDGTPSGANRFVTNTDPRNTDARAPTSHASTHLTGQSDAIAVVTTVTNGLALATDKTKLDAFSAATEYTRRDGTVAFTGNQSMGGNSVTDTRLVTLNEVALGTINGAVNLDLSASTGALVFTATLTGTVNFTFTLPPKAVRATIWLAQDATGNRQITLPAGTYFAGGAQPVLSPNGNELNILTITTNSAGQVAASLTSAMDVI